MNRRSFLSAAAAALPGLGMSPQDPPPPPAARRRRRIGVSTYSFWHFKGPRVEIADCIESAARMGFDGVEILHEQMAGDSNAYLQDLKRRAFVNGLDLMGFSIHQGFVTPDAELRKKHISHTKYCIDLAARLGIPTLRLNTGRWGTIRSFDALMAARGVEPVPEGRTDDEAFKWVIDAIEKCLPRAEECGVTMGLENHWGLGRTAAGVMRIVDELRSPWLRTTLDTGNFLEDMYPQMEALAPKAVLVQAKTYFGGGEWYTLEIDYERVAKILDAARFHGYVSLEFEGKEPAATGVPRSLELLRRTLGG